MKRHPQYSSQSPRRGSRIGTTIGLDLGDVWSHFTIDEEVEVIDREALPNHLERPGPKSVSPAMYCSGVRVVVW
jgi:hypothetical protein